MYSFGFVTIKVIGKSHTATSQLGVILELMRGRYTQTDWCMQQNRQLIKSSLLHSCNGWSMIVLQTLNSYTFVNTVCLLVLFTLFRLMFNLNPTN